MTIRQQGGVFGRNPTFHNVDVTGTATFEEEIAVPSLLVSSNSPLLKLSDGNANADFSQTRVVNDAGNIRIQTYTSVDGFVSNDYLLDRDASGATKHAFRIGNSEKLAVLSTGDTKLTNGNLVIGTSGKGIDFSATAGTGTSELFDDYEEGAYTPIFQDVSQPTYVSQEGRYTKIGDVVYFYIKVEYSGLNTSDPSTFSLTLPFTVSKSGSGGIINGATNTGYVGTSTDNITVSCSEGGAKILITTNNSYNDGDYDSGRWASAGIVNFAGWYFAA